MERETGAVECFCTRKQLGLPSVRSYKLSIAVESGFLLIISWATMDEKYEVRAPIPLEVDCCRLPCRRPISIDRKW